MARILFISTSLPPVADSQTIRNIFLINGLLKRGHQVHLIQPPSAEGDPTLEAMLAGRVERTITELPGYDVLIDRLRARIVHPGLRLFLHRVIARLAGFVCVPDVRAGWDKKAYAASVRSVTRLPDIIISSSGSNTAHMAAAKLSRDWKRPWVAEFGDPWSLNPLRPASHRHIRSMNRRIERRTLRSASGIVFTTAETRDAFNRHNLATRGVSTTVIPCGYDGSHFKISSKTSADSNAEIVLSYTGTAQRGSRDLSPLIDAIQQALSGDLSLPSMRIRLAGSIDGSIGSSLPPNSRLRIEHLGWLPYGGAIRELMEASALLLIGNRSNLQIPAKVYNYLASGKPIIYLAQQSSATDPAWQLLKNFDQCTAIRCPSAETQNSLRAFIHRIGLQFLPCANQMNGILSWEELGERLSVFVESVLASAESHAYTS